MRHWPALIVALCASAGFGFDFKSGVPAGAKLRGETRLVHDPQQGQVMEVGWGDPRRAEGLWLSRAEAWSPPEGFRVRVVFKLHAEPKDRRVLVLVDNKGLYAAPPERKDRHCGWALVLAPSAGTTRVPTGYFGHGEFSQSAKGRALELGDGRWHEIEMFFSAAGEVSFTVDGALNARCTIAPGAVAPARMATVVGERAVGNYNASGARFAAVEILPVAVPPLSLRARGRTAFERLESGARLRVELSNNSDRPLAGLRLNGRELGEIAARTAMTAEVPVDTVVRPGVYKVPLEVTGPRRLAAEAEVFIAPRFLDAIPVLMRRGPINDLLPAYGFTHQMIHLTDALGPGAGVPAVESLERQIDDGVRHGLRWVDIISIAHDWARRGLFLRVDRAGKPYARANVEASNPEVQRRFEQQATRAAAVIQANPFVDLTVVNNEVRDGSMPSFGKFEPENYRKFSGGDIPAEVRGRRVNYLDLPGFPKSRVVPDDHRLLKYYRWFFKDGDGWNVVQRRTNRVYKQTVTRPGYHTIYDPITRVPPLWGSGGDVDGMSQWVYTNPDPVKVSLVLDELEAMGRAFAVPRQIHLCIQSIWYRSKTAPSGVTVKDPPPWLAREPEAKFITVAPDHVQEAVWLAAAHRLDGLATHGYGALIEEQPRSYRYTNPESREVFKRMVRQVVRPLGPVIHAVPERRPDMVVLESFASQIFAGHGTNGWGSGWIADLYLALVWAHYQPGVIYEEELLRDRLAGVKVLVLPGCEVLSQSVYDAIRAFQRRGGIVVGDEYLVPGIIPDVSVNSVARKPADAAASKAELQKLGAAIRAELDEVYRPGADADSPDVVVRRRTYRDADYLFVVNDKRTYGDYVGPWRMVMEKGLPNRAWVTVDRSCGAAYDLVLHRAVPFESAGGKTRFHREFATNEGSLVLLLPEPIAAMGAEVPPAVFPGRRFRASVMLRGAGGQPVPALVPVRAALVDAAGEELEGSGYFCCRDGRLDIDFTPSRNDPPGALTFRAECLASGHTVEKKLRLVKNAPVKAVRREYRTGKIRVFYDTEGLHAVDPADGDKSGVPDQVEDIAKQTWAAWTLFVQSLGFPDPFKSERFGRAAFLDIHLLAKSTLRSNGVAYDELQTFRRPSDPEGTQTICFNVATSVKAPANLTPAHEMFHLIQYGTSYFKNAWYSEGTARWSEHALGLGGVGEVRGTWPLSDEGRKRLFEMSYQASAEFWNPLALADDPQGEIPAGKVCRELRELAYSNGEKVLKDLRLNGWELMREVLLELGKADRAASRALGYTRWSEKNQNAKENGPFIYDAVMEVLRRRGHAAGKRREGPG